jgi:hypothetical protein
MPPESSHRLPRRSAKRGISPTLALEDDTGLPFQLQEGHCRTSVACSRAASLPIGQPGDVHHATKVDDRLRDDNTTPKTDDHREFPPPRARVSLRDHIRRKRRRPDARLVVEPHTRRRPRARRTLRPRHRPGSPPNRQRLSPLRERLAQRCQLLAMTGRSPFTRRATSAVAPCTAHLTEGRASQLHRTRGKLRQGTSPGRDRGPCPCRDIGYLRRTTC